MRLADIKGKRLLTTISTCTEAIGRVMEDEDVKALFTKEEAPEGEDARAFAMRRITKALPGILDRHADDIILALGTLASNTPEGRQAGMTVERYAEEGDVLTDLVSLLNDRDFLSFLA